MPWPLVVFRLFFAVAMLLGPGYLIARLAKMDAKYSLAFPLSSVVLFCVLFWMHSADFSLTFLHAAAAELAICAILIVLLMKQRPSLVPAGSTRWTTADKLCACFAAIVVVILLWRSLMAPLAGFDTYFRWNFLAEQILKFHRYDFYPPITPADFHKYFYVDAIPPLVSLTYWWLYAAAGSSWPRLTVIPVLLQYLSVMGLVFSLARHFAGVRAGAFAIAALACSSLFFHDVAIAQETGLTAVAMVGLLYALCLYAETFSGCAVAGAMVALAAMSREYGWAFLFCAIVALALLPKKYLAITVLISLLLAGPWYVRTWWLTGNPFYSVPFFAMTVNPVIGSLLHFCRETLGITTWTPGNWLSMALYLLESSILQWTLGIIGIVILLRQRIKLRPTITLLAAVVSIIALWLYSVGNTGGGPWYSTRVLSPALAVLSITAGVALAQNFYPFLSRMILVCAAVCALISAWIYPAGFSSLSAPKWLSFGAAPWIHTQPAERVGPLLSQAGFSPSQQILSSNAYLYVGLLRDGFTVTPPWRPDLSFLFNPKITPEESCRRLIALHITAVEFDPNSMNTAFLDRSSNFFHQLYHDPRGYRPIVQLGNTGILLLPGE